MIFVNFLGHYLCIFFNLIYRFYQKTIVFLPIFYIYKPQNKIKSKDCKNRYIYMMKGDVFPTF